MVFYLSFLVLFSICAVDVCGFNIDTRTATLYNPPNHARRVFFGFSVALHLHRNETWLLVGAPFSDVNSTNETTLYRYGAVFKCDTAGSKECQDLNIDNEPEKTAFYPRGTNNVVTMEIKSGQMLGGTLQSKNGIVLACAPRYTNKRDVGRERLSVKEPNLMHFLTGGCYVMQNSSNRSKVENWRFLDPCKGRSKFIAYCQAGFSADIAKDAVIMGKVGLSSYYERKIIQWAGGLEKYSLTTTNYVASEVTKKQEKLEYLGYDVASGHFSHPNSDGIAGGAPKGHDLKGKVFIYEDLQENDSVVFRSELELPDKNQTGSYFGGTICAVDLNNDGLTDLLVGAPLYTDNMDEGRVFVYLNKKGVLTYMANIVLQGDNKQGARFGTAISNVGDLNRDGYQDVVIGAPYEGHNSSGAVYVYYGSKNGIEAHYRQKIVASMINDQLKGFGYSISGAVDVDKNGYPDIAVGSYWSDQAVLLKTRRIVEINADIKLSRTKIVLENSEFVCEDDDQTRHKCLNVSICFQFKDREPSNRQDLKIAYDLEADRDIRTIQLRRIYFYHKKQRSFTISGELTIPSQGQVYCLSPFTVYINNGYQFLDLLKPLTFDLSFSLADKSCWLDLDVPCPVLDAYQPTSIRNDELMFQKQCKGHVCKPDLSITGRVKLPGKHASVLRVGSSGVLSTVLDIDNTAHDASYQTTVMLHFPDELSYIGPTTSKSILCSSSYINETSKATCQIGNPFKAKSKKSLTIEFSAQDVTSSFNITVVVASKSNDTNLLNNELVLPVTVKYVTDLQITGVSQPNEVIYHGKTRNAKNFKRQTDIGPLVLQTILIENHGPSFVDGVGVKIQIPQLKIKDDPESRLLYLQQVELSGGAGRCNASTNSLSIPESNSTYQGHYEKQERHQQQQQQQQQVDSSNVKIMDCFTAVCYSFSCHLGLIPAGSSVHIKITARLWQNTLIRDKQGPIRLVTRAGLTVPPKVMQTNTTNDDVKIELIARPSKVGGTVKEEIAWWIILVAALAGVLLLLLIIFILYKCGFFSRTRPDDEGASPEETKPMKV